MYNITKLKVKVEKKKTYITIKHLKNLKKLKYNKNKKLKLTEDENKILSKKNINLTKNVRIKKNLSLNDREIVKDAIFVSTRYHYI